MLASPTTVCPPIEKTFYVYKEYQSLFQELSDRLNIEFIPCLDFKMIKNLESCSLVFDDACEEIYQKQASVKLAVAGRHKKLHFIFVKQNLFLQNQTHVILFKSPRD